MKKYIISTAHIVTENGERFTSVWSTETFAPTRFAATAKALFTHRARFGLSTSAMVFVTGVEVVTSPIGASAVYVAA